MRAISSRNCTTQKAFSSLQSLMFSVKMPLSPLTRKIAGEGDETGTPQDKRTGNVGGI